MQVWRETTGGQTWEAGPSDTSLSLSQSPERPAALGRDPGMSLLHPNSLFSRLGTPKGTTFCPLVKWERESRGWEGGYGELPTRSAFSHPHEVNFFNIGRRAGRRGPGDRGPARGPGWRAGSGRDLEWAATDGPCPRGRPLGRPGCGRGFSDPLGGGESWPVDPTPPSRRLGTRESSSRDRLALPGQGEAWPGKLKSRKHEIKSDAPSAEGESGGGRGARRVCVGPSVRVSACLGVRGAGRSTHHLAGGARPLRGRIGNVEASLASSATCWLKHQLGQNKKLLKKNLLKITEIERRRRRLPPPAGPPAPSPAPRPRAQRACVLL